VRRRRFATLALLGPGLLVVVALVPRILHRSVSTAASTTPPSPLSPWECYSLAKRYAADWQQVNRCTSDEDCIATPVPGALVRLDRCARYGPRSADAGAAEAQAQAWLAGGCAKDFDACVSVPEPVCRQGRCTDRPPPPVPAGWYRAEVEGTFALFLPPDLVEQHMMGEDSIELGWGSERMTVRLDYGPWSMRVDTPPSPRVSLEEITVGGEPAKLRITRPAPQPPGTRREPRTEVAVNFPRVVGAPSSRYPVARLTVVIECKGLAPCPDAEAIARSIHFYYAPVARRP